jgi:hypothetical protein
LISQWGQETEIGAGENTRPNHNAPDLKKVMGLFLRPEGYGDFNPKMSAITD